MNVPGRGRLLSQDPELNGEYVLVIEALDNDRVLCALEEEPRVSFYWPLAQMETVETVEQ
jgi:hypothetical protein